MGKSAGNIFLTFGGGWRIVPIQLAECYRMEINRTVIRPLPWV
jgi:hypothetical protein